MMGAYVLLFGWAVVHTVYADHNYLVRAASESQKNLIRCQDVSSPKLGGWINVTNFHGKEKAGHLLVVKGMITNQGAPTAIIDMNLEIRFANGKKINGHILPIPLTPFALKQTASDKNPSFLEPQDYFSQVEKKHPITTGGARSGWLYASFPEVISGTILEDAHATVILTVFDVNDKPWPIEQIISKEIRREN
jgi:hypothetical protein